MSNYFQTYTCLQFSHRFFLRGSAVCKVFMFFALLGMFSSCVRDGESTDACNNNVRLTFEWIDTEPLDHEGEIKVDVAPQTSDNFSITARPAGCAVDLSWDMHDFMATEDADNIHRDGRLLTVAENADGLAKEAGFFNGGTAAVELLGFQDYEIVIPMRKQARQVMFMIDFADGFAETITEMSGKLSGIAISRDVDEGFPPVDGQRRHGAVKNGAIGYHFTSQPTLIGDPVFVGGRWLLGLDGDTPQELTLDIRCEDGQEVSCVVDITHMFSYTEGGQLKDYYLTDTHDPWVIRMTLDMCVAWLPVVIDWKAGGESWYVAE